MHVGIKSLFYILVVDLDYISFHSDLLLIHRWRSGLLRWMRRRQRQCPLGQALPRRRTPAHACSISLHYMNHMLYILLLPQTFSSLWSYLVFGLIWSLISYLRQFIPKHRWKVWFACTGGEVAGWGGCCRGGGHVSTRRPRIGVGRPHVHVLWVCTKRTTFYT